MDIHVRVIIFVVLLIIVFPGFAEAFSFTGSILDPIKDGVLSMLSTIATAIKDAFVYVVTFIFDAIKSVVYGVLESLSTTAREVMASANATFQDALLKDNMVGFITKIMHTGPMESAFFRKKFNVDEEIRHLDESLSFLETLAISAIIFLLIYCVILIVLINQMKGMNQEIQKKKAEQRKYTSDKLARGLATMRERAARAAKAARSRIQRAARRGRHGPVVGLETIPEDVNEEEYLEEEQQDLEIDPEEYQNGQEFGEDMGDEYEEEVYGGEGDEEEGYHEGDDEEGYEEEEYDEEEDYEDEDSDEDYDEDEESEVESETEESEESEEPEEESETPEESVSEENEEE
jgi:hypothetical protein